MGGGKSILPRNHPGVRIDVPDRPPRTPPSLSLSLYEGRAWIDPYEQKGLASVKHEMWGLMADGNT